MRKAKIVCTLGPATDPPGVLEALVRAGLDVARLNFSHGTHEDHARRFRRVRQVSKMLGKPIAVLQDLQGPKIRVGEFEGGQITLTAGEEVTVTTRRCLGKPGLIPTPVQSLPKDVKPGDPILLNDGRLRLRVRAVRGKDIRCEVEQGGPLKDHKGLNLPGAAMSVPALTKKDLEDLDFGLSLGVDYVALSFVRSPRDLERARARMKDREVPLIAKIEKPQAVVRVIDISRAGDGIMVARGDLGVEMELERLPALQKQMLREVNVLGGLTIVATEMLESMIQSERPTRAEVSDVANAILDGADAVMLSGETASGKFPVEAVSTMARIVAEAEREGIPVFSPPYEESREISTGVAAAAVAAAQQLRVDLIVAYTESGRTARQISEMRPRARILGLTPNVQTAQRMALYWGVEPLVVSRVGSTDGMLRQTRQICLHRAGCKRGQTVVLVGGAPNEPGRTHFLSVHTL